MDIQGLLATFITNVCLISASFIIIIWFVCFAIHQKEI